MSDFALLFWQQIFPENIIFFHFLGVALLFISSREGTASLASGLKYSLAIMLSGLLGWLFMRFAGLNYQFYVLWIYLILSTPAVFLLDKWNELKGKWLGMPVKIFALIPFVGIQKLVVEKAVGYSEAFAYLIGTTAGFYLVFLLIVSVREQIHISDAPAIFKNAFILLLTMGVLALAFAGFQFL